MIDYFALALGHGLMVIALLRLLVRDGLDADPLTKFIKSEEASRRMGASTAGRNEARRARQPQGSAGSSSAGENGAD